ncbi:MAG: hypothetical protein M9891_03610 [Austwickia sp.]|nr:hypothetical protein [Actinomycetota bacterium]MCO5308375.1 hypothetical protein [Austwickia sp.]
MSTGATPQPGQPGGPDVEAVCLATMEMLDAHMPMIAAAVATTQRLVKGASDAANASPELREHVDGLVASGRDVAQRLGRAADMSLHLLSQGAATLEPELALQLRSALLDRVGDLGGMSAKLRMAQSQLARLV